MEHDPHIFYLQHAGTGEPVPKTSLLSQSVFANTLKDTTWHSALESNPFFLSQKHTGKVVQFDYLHTSSHDHAHSIRRNLAEQNLCRVILAQQFSECLSHRLQRTVGISLCLYSAEQAFFTVWYLKRVMTLSKAKLKTLLSLWARYDT